MIRYAAHELRTPLASALTNLEVLAAHLNGEEAELAVAALESTARMSRLIEDLLLLSSSGAGGRPACGRVDLADVLADVTVELAPIASSHELSVAGRSVRCARSPR